MLCTIRVKVKPYMELKDSDGRDDAEVAKEVHMCVCVLVMWVCACDVLCMCVACVHVCGCVCCLQDVSN